MLHIRNIFTHNKYRVLFHCTTEFLTIFIHTYIYIKHTMLLLQVILNFFVTEFQIVIISCNERQVNLVRSMAIADSHWMSILPSNGYNTRELSSRVRIPYIILYRHIEYAQFIIYIISYFQSNHFILYMYIHRFVHQKLHNIVIFCA